MNRINIVGPPGAGKTYLAREMARIYDLPIVHMDYIAHTDLYNPMKDKPAFIHKISKEISKKKWIMEGVYKSTLVDRIPNADLTIYLDFPRHTYIYRVFKRRFQHRNKKRTEMPDYWVEKIDWGFFKYVWRFHKTQRPLINEIIREFSDKNIATIKSKKELKVFLLDLEIDS
jgi:adenylate kinase family enzyme